LWSLKTAVAVCCLLLAASIGGFAVADDGPGEEDAFYVVAIRLNGTALVDYYDLVEGADGTLYLPVEPIFQAGEALVVPTAEQLLLSVSSTGRELTLDRSRRTLTAGEGGGRTLLPEDYRYVDDTYLLAEHLLAETFQLDIDFRSATQELLIKSTRPFPKDLRLARERAWDRLNAELTPEVPVRLQAQDYTLFGSPQADIAIGGQTGGTSPTSAAWSALVVSEALYLTHHLYSVGNSGEPLTNLRLRSGRMSPAGGVFGLAPLYDAQAGDISGMRIPLVGSGGSGRGLRLQASPLRRATNFDTTLIEGDAPAGWDVELYLGLTLLDYQRVGDDGRYRFDDVPLDYGINQLKVVLYGPQGQIREELFREQIGAGMVPPGKVYGSAYLLEDGQSLFNQGQGTGDVEPGLWQGGVKADIGVLKRLTLGLFAARSPLPAPAVVKETGATGERERDDYFGVELRPSLGSLVVETGAAGQGKGGAAAYGLFAMPLFGSSISGSYHYYDENFVSRDNDNGLLSSRAGLRFSVPLGRAGSRPGSIGVGLSEQQPRQGEAQREASLSYGHRLGPVFLGHQAELNWMGDTVGEASGLYTLRASYRRDLFDLRGETGYGLGDGGSLQTMTVSGLWRKSEKNRLFASLAYSPGSDSFSYGLGWTWDMGLASLSCNASAGDGEFSVGLGLSFSFGHTPARGLNMSSQSRAAMGFADLHIFEDIDADGVFTPGRDQPLPDAGVMVNRRPLADLAADSTGRIGMDGLSIYDPLEIEVNTSSLADPFLVPVFPGVRAWPRPGRAMALQLPVAESGEISGYVRMAFALEQGGEGGTPGELEKVVLTPLPGIRLQVLNGKGELHAEVFTFTDGYFIFDTVYPGRWTVRIAPGQSFRGIPLAGSAIKVEIRADQRFVGDFRPLEILLTREDLYYHDLDLTFDRDGSLRPLALVGDRYLPKGQGPLAEVDAVQAAPAGEGQGPAAGRVQIGPIRYEEGPTAGRVRIGPVLYEEGPVAGRVRIRPVLFEERPVTRLPPVEGEEGWQSARLIRISPLSIAKGPLALSRPDRPAVVVQR
jgi:hypothetical protein